MKVVTQLIRHFWQRGALSTLEIESLLRHGFVRVSDLPGYKAPKAQELRPSANDLPPAVPIEPAGPLEVLEETLIRRSHVRRSSAASKGKVLHVADLCERLRAEYHRRSGDLRSLHALGKRFGDCSGWYDAAILLRQVSPEDLLDGLRAELVAENVLLGDLWQAVDPEPLHGLLNDEELRGRAARAFAALLVANDSVELGRYVWLLKYHEMRAVINLRVIHERILVSLKQLYEMDQRLITSALQRNSDPIQFWALVLIYNAKREAASNELPDFGQEYGPVPLPELPLWKQAWSSALAMDRAPVTNLLISCYEGADDAADVHDTACQRGIMCPVGWHVP